MRTRNLKEFGLLLPALLTAAGCAATPEEPAAPVAVVQEAPPAVQETAAVVEEPVYEATPGLTPQERLQAAVGHLNTGNEEQAAAELRAYIAEVPNAGQGNYLLRQIEAPIGELFPAESFVVQVAEGETLGSLASTYLGNVLGFYGLARYNEIDNPSLVSVGQSIHIPSTPEALAAHEARLAGIANPAEEAAEQAPAATAAAAPPPAPAGSDDQWASIRAHVAARRFGEAVAEAEDSRLVPNAEQAVLLASAYDNNARAIRGTNQAQAAAHALRAGELYLEAANRPEEAMNALILAAELSPGNAAAETMLATARTRAADIYYRNGVAAFQRQDLDGAIAAYDRVLLIDPNHQNAQVNRLQAIELRANLERLQ